MVDMASIGAAASALKSAIDISKTAIDLRDATLMRDKIIEMQREISSALASAVSANTDQMTLLKQVQALEAEITDLKTWNAEKERYELKTIGHGCIAYMLKEPMRGTEPPHWLCPNCYAKGQQGYFQATGGMTARRTNYSCVRCSSGIAVEGRPEWS